MAYTYVFDPIAAIEYREAFQWYEERSPIAADNLILAVQDAIHEVCVNPERYRNPYKNFRETSIKKYPYYLIYIADKPKKLIVITSLYHHKRRPAGKYKKPKKK